jgi:hypothetical protein
MKEPKQEISVTKKVIKCYCGHTTTCDCGPKEEPKQETLKMKEYKVKVYERTI